MAKSSTHRTETATMGTQSFKGAARRSSEARRLTPPSSGRRPASFAVWPPPLMSNVRHRQPMPSYAWSCHVCARRNEPGAIVCSHCGFPAAASGAEIEEARARLAGPVCGKRRPVAPDSVGAIRRQLAPLPLAGKVLAILLGISALACYVTYQISASLSVIALSLVGGFASLVLLCWLVISGQQTAERASQMSSPPSPRTSSSGDA